MAPCDPCHSAGNPEPLGLRWVFLATGWATPMRNLNLDQLQALVEVVEHGSISAAAKKLNLTQPAVSQQLRELEGRLGTPLLRRDGRQSTPTAAGKELAAHARDIFESTRRAMTVVRRHRDGSLGRVRIGVGNAALRYVLLPVLARLRREHPAIELAVTTGSTCEIVERMARNVIDLGFTGLPVEDDLLETIDVRGMSMVAVLPAFKPDLPAALSPRDFIGRPLIGLPRRANLAQLARDWLQAGGVDLRPEMQIDNVDAILQAVAAGLGAALVPEVALSQGNPPPGVVVRPLDPPVALRLGLIRRRNRADDPAIAIVQEAILSLSDEGAEVPALAYAAVSQASTTRAANRIIP